MSCIADEVQVCAASQADIVVCCHKGSAAAFVTLEILIEQVTQILTQPEILVISIHSCCGRKRTWGR